jgi:hypothetical protein
VARISKFLVFCLCAGSVASDIAGYYLAGVPAKDFYALPVGLSLLATFSLIIFSLGKGLLGERGGQGY